MDNKLTQTKLKKIWIPLEDDYLEALEELGRLDDRRPTAIARRLLQQKIIEEVAKLAPANNKAREAK